MLAGLALFPLRSNQLMGVRWRGRLAGAAGPSQSSCPSSPFVYVFDVFWLLSLCCYRDQFRGRCRVVATQGRRVWLWLLCRTFCVTASKDWPPASPR
jgi:hypothetical protein